MQLIKPIKKADFLRADKKYRDDIKRSARSQSAKEQSSPSTPLRSSSTPNVIYSLCPFSIYYFQALQGIYDDQSSISSEHRRTQRYVSQLKSGIFLNHFSMENQNELFLNF